MAAWGRAVDANSWVASAVGQPLVFTLGTTKKGEVSIVAIEAWPGWFTLRIHISEEWEAQSGGIQGAWTASDDWGNSWRGFEKHTSGKQTGFSQDMAFVGEVDPRATLLRVNVATRETTALEVDIPIDPGTWSGR
jgi:hypothetical protein